jgi:SAM-dependent methyltransferase
MNECMSRARAAGATAIGLHTSRSFRAAVQMYTAMGFERVPEHDFQPPGAELVEASADELPFEDSSFDTAVFTLVLCTVPDPQRALAEAARVLKPGGKLLFVEHVRAEEPGLARWQDRLETPWRFLADGCHCNRDTIASIEASPFALERVERDELPKAPPLVRPLVRGTATLPT